jgi:hypothetical protein
MAPVTDGRLSNQMIQHPPLVYAAGAALLAGLPGAQDWAYDQQVFLLRALNIALVAPLPILCWAAARRFGLSEPLAGSAALLPLAIPGLTRVGSSFDNDGIIILATGALTVLLAGVMRGDLRLRTAAWVGLWLGVGLLAKAFALALPAVIACAYLVGWQVRRETGVPGTATTPGTRAGAGRLRTAVACLPWKPVALAIGVGSAAGGWWWVRSAILYGTLSPNGWATNPPRREPLLLPDSFFTWFRHFFNVMIDRFWGGLGMFEPPQLSPVAVVTATVFIVFCCAAAVVRRPRLHITDDDDRHEHSAPPGYLEDTEDAGYARYIGYIGYAGYVGLPGNSGRPRLPARIARTAGPLVLLLPLALTYLMVGRRSYAEYERYTRGIAIQGRYLYLGLVGLAVVTVMGLHRLLGGRDWYAPPLVFGGAMAMQALALHAICSYYWLPQGVDVTPDRIPEIVSGIARWAPFPVGVTIAVFTVAAFAATAVTAVTARLVQEARHPPENPPAIESATNSREPGHPTVRGHRLGDFRRW